MRWNQNASTCQTHFVLSCSLILAISALSGSLSASGVLRVDGQARADGSCSSHLPPFCFTAAGKTPWRHWHTLIYRYIPWFPLVEVFSSNSPVWIRHFSLGNPSALIVLLLQEAHAHLLNLIIIQKAAYIKSDEVWMWDQVDLTAGVCPPWGETARRRYCRLCSWCALANKFVQHQIVKIVFFCIFFLKTLKMHPYHMWISAHCFFVLVCARDTVSSWDNQGGEETVTPRGGEGTGGWEGALPAALWKIERHRDKESENLGTGEGGRVSGCDRQRARLRAPGTRWTESERWVRRERRQTAGEVDEGEMGEGRRDTWRKWGGGEAGVIGRERRREKRWTPKTRRCRVAVEQVFWMSCLWVCRSKRSKKKLYLNW